MLQTNIEPEPVKGEGLVLVVIVEMEAPMIVVMIDDGADAVMMEGGAGRGAGAVEMAPTQRMVRVWWSLLFLLLILSFYGSGGWSSGD